MNIKKKSLMNCKVLQSVLFNWNPQDLLLLNIDSRFYLSAHVSDVNTLDNDCEEKRVNICIKMMGLRNIQKSQQKMSKKKNCHPKSHLICSF